MAVFLERRLLFVTGKGGVGKSTVASALALRCARSGLRTLAVELNTQERISRLLERPPAGANISPLEENLWAVNIRPQEALREYVLMTLKYQAIYRAVFENRVVRTFIRLIPSVQELVLLGKVFFHLREKDREGRPRFDRIVVDAPATGHALSMLSVPQVLLETVPPGPLAQEARIMRDLLVNPEVTSAALVSLPEEMPVNETLELNTALRDQVRLRPGALILNDFTAPRFSEAELQQLKPGSTSRALGYAHLQRTERSVAAMERLQSGIDLPVTPIPRLFEPSWGRRAIERVAEALAPLGQPS